MNATLQAMRAIPELQTALGVQKFVSSKLISPVKTDLQS
jgi:hypothetical protein